MDIFAVIKTCIFLLSSCVLYPVLLLLAGLTLWIFFECGRFLAEYCRRRREPEEQAPAVRRYHQALQALQAGRHDEADIQNLLRRSIGERYCQLDRFRLVVRIGPALGLMGTLVPMGSALASLGQGDMTVMTGELVLAYTTTVVGLLVGSVAYVIYMLRRRFAESDVRCLEYLTEKSVP